MRLPLTGPSKTQGVPQRIAAIAMLCATIGACTRANTQAATRAPADPGPQIAGCPVFPADNVWNTPIDKLAVDPRSKDYVASIGADKMLHPDFGADSSNGIPVTIINGSTPYIKVDFDYADESDPGTYPIPPNALVEGGPGAGGDTHVILVDKDRCMLAEFWSAHRLSDTHWKAGSGMKMDLTSNALRPDGKTSADAAGLPVLPGLVRYDEVAAGEIRHALRFTAPKTQDAYVWPARHAASHSKDAKLPPLGVRFRLRADFDISGYSKENQVILTALKRYGMFLADNGAPWFLSGSPDPRWNDDDLHRLGGVKGSDFEAVNEADWQFLPDSGRVDPTSRK
jgi:hypothetical protein